MSNQPLEFEGKILGENANMRFGFEHISSVSAEDDVIYVGAFAKVPLVLSSVKALVIAALVAERDALKEEVLDLQWRIDSTNK